MYATQQKLCFNKASFPNFTLHIAKFLANISASNCLMVFDSLCKIWCLRHRWFWRYILHAGRYQPIYWTRKLMCILSFLFTQGSTDNSGTSNINKSLVCRLLQYRGLSLILVQFNQTNWIESFNFKCVNLYSFYDVYVDIFFKFVIILFLFWWIN